MIELTASIRSLKLKLEQEEDLDEELIEEGEISPPQGEPLKAATFCFPFCGMLCGEFFGNEDEESLEIDRDFFPNFVTVSA